MKIKFYGTSAAGGIPGIFCCCRVCEHARKYGGKNVRTRSQAVIDDCLGLEFPVDTLAHTAYRGLDMRTVRHILITHAHHDHFMPEDVLTGPKGIDEVHFYCSAVAGKKLQDIIDRREQARKAGSGKPANGFKATVHALEYYHTYEINGYQVTPLRANHQENMGPSLYIIRKDGKSVFWGFDTGVFRDDVWTYLKESGLQFDFVVLDCTLKKINPATDGHMDMERCKEMRDRMASLGVITPETRVVLSHFSHLLECTHEELCDKAAELGFEVAYDGMEIVI